MMIHRVKIGVVSVAVLGVLLLVTLGRLAPPRTGRTAAESPRITHPWSDRCIAVADGDTISVMHDGVAIRIRLNGVDCPEKSQAFGSVAKRFTSDRVFGKVVTVNPTDTDRYGRTVADVHTPDGGSLKEALVAAGLAWWYRRYAPDDRRLQALEADARKVRRGLWRDGSSIPPWEFRRMRRRLNVHRHDDPKHSA